ncbi:related to CDC28-cyclin-dependent protein kinase [Sporisorium scitamineum]|uniref:Related to CDC28-cyclin-dependent protein kinase n=1 Tax=Sporisorium scitamineum TaxID=49012 RepID=A0A127ZB89_9BASI|nr:related to CDC28-cyclin-dependent protein kinase [Sporisorium scitamineum]
MVEQDADTATQLAAQSDGEVQGSREAALRQRLVDARKQRRGNEDVAVDQPETKRQRIDGIDEDREDSDGSALNGASTQAKQQQQPQPSTPWKPAPTWSGLRRSAHPPIAASRSIYAYERLNHIQEGTYGVVFRARPRDPPPSSSSTTTPPTPGVVAVKKLKLAQNGLDHHGFPITSLREIQTLYLSKSHRNIVQLHEICIGKTLDQIFLVMEFMEHDLKTLLTFKHKFKQTFAPSEVKTLMHQLLSAVAHLHGGWVVHRDLKSSNLLMNNRGVLKVADFGLARRFGDPVDGWVAKDRPRTLSVSNGSDQEKMGGQEGGMTDLVVTLWYRAPELLMLNHIYRARETWHTPSKPSRSLSSSNLFNLHSKPYPQPRPPLPLYDEKIDMWSVGCIFAELLFPATLPATSLFQGSDEPDQLRRIDAVLGGHNTTNWPDVVLWMGLPHQHTAPSASVEEVEREVLQRKARLEAALGGTKVTSATLDLLFQLLQYDPKQRISAKEALEHEYFTSEKPRMAHPDSFGSFPSVAAGESVVYDTPEAPRRAVGGVAASRDKKYTMEFDFAA